ncbi:MAG: hypothetical protein P8J59_07915 [Phycisphaerales bacterium]|nr:hypothetical protein [Phycisphaerales bacterium]
MTNRIQRPTTRMLRDLTALTALTAVSLGLAACGSEEAPPPPAPVAKKAPPPPPPPAAPTVTPIADLMAKYDIDPRVNLSEDLAPDNDAGRIAVLRFFDGFARGDSSRVEGMLAGMDALLLKDMTASGEWQEATSNIIGIDVRTGTHPVVGDCALAVFMVGNQFEPQLWAYEISGDPAADGAEFDAQPSPPNMMDRLSGDDWITAWFNILGEEMARATAPDEIVEIPAQDFTEEESGSSSMGSPAGGPGGGGNAPGKRKRPKGPKIDPNPGFAPSGN